MNVLKKFLAAFCMAAILLGVVGCGSDKSSSSSKADSPKVQGKYLVMTAQDFARSYNFTISKLGKDHLQIVNTEVKGRDVIYTIKASECRMGGMVQDGELVAVMVKGNKSSADFPVRTTSFIAVMDALKNVDGKSVMEQIGQGRTVVENNGVKFIAAVENSEFTFLTCSANYNPK